MALILDSGGLLVALDSAQEDHGAFAEALTFHLGPLAISPFVVAELDCMIGRDYGEEARLAFLDEVERGAYRLEAFEPADFSRGAATVSHRSLAARSGCRLWRVRL